MKIKEIEKQEKIIKDSPYSGITIECDHLSITKSDNKNNEKIKIHNAQIINPKDLTKIKVVVEFDERPPPEKNYDKQDLIDNPSLKKLALEEEEANKYYKRSGNMMIHKGYKPWHPINEIWFFVYYDVKFINEIEENFHKASLQNKLVEINFRFEGFDKLDFDSSGISQSIKITNISYSISNKKIRVGFINSIISLLPSKKIMGLIIVLLVILYLLN
tara:strand:- start:292 stop:942 length:651 start_codon:yes stop_codon:yes gene_type:complete